MDIMYQMMYDETKFGLDQKTQQLINQKETKDERDARLRLDMIA